ncbi:hypothetical protein PCANC_17682 [Puccinia coronata f. sp. avenae]|uniref:Uncharacterized protein n=1 Tax=Puccinia coronata f. sp. avenae TaxID=200324 RepID=A0A2N5U977_9BASI|nr:hypothetical protein PCANC_17682 [Puccinia coronata f. sp. avenae]
MQVNPITAGNNRLNTAVRAVLEQPCSTGGRTGTVRPKHLPAGRTGLSDQFLGPVGQDQPGPVGQICLTSWLLLRSDSARPTTGRTRLFEHRSNCRVQPVNAGSASYYPFYFQDLPNGSHQGPSGNHQASSCQGGGQAAQFQKAGKKQHPGRMRKRKGYKASIYAKIWRMGQTLQGSYQHVDSSQSKNQGKNRH